MNLLDEMQAKVSKRLQELEPLVEEYEQLRRLAETLASGPAGAREAVSPRAAATPRRSAPRRRSRASRPPTREVGAQREGEVLELITKEPGLTVSAVSERLKVERTGLYRVIRRLESRGAVVKDGPALHPAQPPS